MDDKYLREQHKIINAVYDSLLVVGFVCFIMIVIHNTIR